MRPFLLSSAVCDAEHPSVVELSRELVGSAETVSAAAAAVRAWVREHIVYTLQDKSDRASDTLEKREGMCTNKANLQIALLRAAGIPAAYTLVHITKEAFAGPHTLPEVYEPISEITLHVRSRPRPSDALPLEHTSRSEIEAPAWRPWQVFCSVYIPAEELVPSPPVSGKRPRVATDPPEVVEWEEEAAGAPPAAAAAAAAAAAFGEFRCYDATERPGSALLMEPLAATGETRYRQRWLRGPLLPPQGCIDHQLLRPCWGRNRAV